jgi:hypothetical protein
VYRIDEELGLDLDAGKRCLVGQKRDLVAKDFGVAAAWVEENLSDGWYEEDRAVSSSTHNWTSIGGRPVKSPNNGLAYG